MGGESSDAGIAFETMQDLIFAYTFHARMSSSGLVYLSLHARASPIATQGLSNLRALDLSENPDFGNNEPPEGVRVAPADVGVGCGVSMRMLALREEFMHMRAFSQIQKTP